MPECAVTAVRAKPYVARGLTQDAFSNPVGVRPAVMRPAVIGVTELGQRPRIDFVILDRLATALDVEPGELLEREEKP